MRVLRESLSFLARNQAVRRAVTAMPVSAGIVAGYVPGEGTADAVRAVADLARTGRLATIDHLGEDTVEPAQAERTVRAYLDLLTSLAEEGLTEVAEVSVKLTALGLMLPDDGPRTALANARRICLAARNAGTTVTIDAEDHTTTDATLAILRELRQDFPETGAVLQAYLRRQSASVRRR